MTVSDERPGLADLGRDITPVLPANRPVPLAPPAGADDLPRYLHALRRLADADDLAAAHSGCTLAVEVAGRDGSAAGLAMAYSQRSSVARRLGRLADGLLAATGLGGDLPDEPEFLLLRYVRGRLHTAAGRPGEGLADLYRCGERLAVRRSDRPAVLPWRSAAASVLVGLGAQEAAERLVAEEVALTRRHGLASALGRALRIQGQVRPGPPGLAAAEEAIRVLQGTPRRFELATALVDLGALLNAARRRPQARRVLRDGLELAQVCGSPALEARARALFAGRR